MNKFIRRVCFAFVVLFFITGCSINSLPQGNQRAVKATIISPIIKLSDAGFIHRYKHFIMLQIYSSGVALASIKTGKNICINGVCYSKDAFNEKFFKNKYYDDLLDDILDAREIFGGINLTKNECGFYQDISKFSIRYLVCNDEVEFRNKTTKIIIKELK